MAMSITAQGEPEAWYRPALARRPPSMSQPGSRSMSIAAIFAPIRFHMAVIDHWKHYNRPDTNG